MAERRLTVMIAISNVERVDELGHILENDGIAVAIPSELELPSHFDVVVTDGEPLDGETPHILLGDSIVGANIRAVLPSASDATLVVAAVRLAAAGYRIAHVAAQHADDLHYAEAGMPNEHVHVALTPREMETLALLADGASNKVIARQLEISVHTAKFHVAAVLTKLHAQNRADAVAIGLRQGLLYL